MTELYIFSNSKRWYNGTRQSITIMGEHSFDVTHLKCSPGRLFILKLVFAQVHLTPLYSITQTRQGEESGLHKPDVMYDGAVWLSQTLRRYFCAVQAHTHVLPCVCVYTYLFIYHTARGTHLIYLLCSHLVMCGEINIASLCRMATVLVLHTVCLVQFKETIEVYTSN